MIWVLGFIAFLVICFLLAWAGYRRGYQDGLKDSSFQELPY